jgi:flagellar assembly factor FliW
MKRSVKTTRFGEINIDQQHTLHFKDGMVGFHQLKDYFLVESPSVPLLLWLQSADNPEVAFPIMEAGFFKKDYQLQLLDADKYSLQLESKDVMKTFFVMTIPEDATKMTVNMKAPVIINLTKRTGTQVIQQDKNLLVRKPAYEIFSDLVSAYQLSQGTSANQSVENVEEVWSPIELHTHGVEKVL